jgi:hypothetical protein
MMISNPCRKHFELLCGVLALAISCGEKKQSATRENLLLQHKTTLASTHTAHLSTAEDGFLFAAREDQGLHIYSTQVKENPVLIGDLSYPSYRFRRFNGTGFLLGRSQGMAFVDLNDPTRPQLQLSFAMRTMQDSARDVLQYANPDTKESILLVASPFHGLLGYSEREQTLVPNNVVEKPATIGTLHQLENLGEAILALEYPASLLVLAKKEWPRLEVVQRIAVDGTALSFKIFANTLLVTTLNAGIILFNVENPLKPERIAQIPVVGLCRDAAFFDPYLIVAHDSKQQTLGLSVIDIRNSSNPHVVESHIYHDKILSLGQLDRTLYAAGEKAGIHVFQFSGTSP